MLRLCRLIARMLRVTSKKMKGTELPKLSVDKNKVDVTGAKLVKGETRKVENENNVKFKKSMEPSKGTLLMCKFENPKRSEREAANLECSKVLRP